MLRISKLADYATVIMVTLAGQPKSFHNAKALSALCQIAAPTVSKCLKQLAAAGLLQSQRGVNGGYGLARPASRISVADMLAAMEGRQGLTECSDVKGDCQRTADCIMQHNWQTINRAVHSALASVSLAQLASSVLTSAAVDVSAIKRLGEQEQREY